MAEPAHAAPTGAVAAQRSFATIGNRGFRMHFATFESRGRFPITPRATFLLAMSWCVALVALALVRSYPIALALLLLAGFFERSVGTMAQTLVQLDAPAELRVRVIGLFSMASSGMRTFSGLTVAWPAAGLAFTHRCRSRRRRVR